MSKNLVRLVLLAFGLFLLISPLVAFGQDSFPPPPTAYVYDGIGAFSPDQIAEINALGAKLHSVTGVTFFAVTVNDCGPEPKQYGRDLFDTWRTGDGTRNDGLHLQFCWNNGVRGKGRAVVPVIGKGIVAQWPESRTSAITDIFVRPALLQDKPANEVLRSGDLGRALLSTYKEYVRQLMPVPPQSPVTQPLVPQAQPVTPPPAPSGDWVLFGISLPPLVWVLAGIAVLVAIVVVWSWWKSSGVSSDSSSFSSTYANTRTTDDRYVEGMIVGQALSRQSHSDNTSSYTPPTYSPPSPSDASFGPSPSFGGTSGGDSSPSFGGSSGSSSSNEV